jgi:hypothetical protein
MGVRVLPLLALALSLGGPASAADHGLKSVRIKAAQGFDVELLEEYRLAATAHHSKAQAGPLELPRPYRLQKVEQVTLGGGEEAVGQGHGGLLAGGDRRRQGRGRASR